MNGHIFDTHPCRLGEGPLWHPLREELFWFDINAHQLRSKTAVWQFDQYVSAAGWVSLNELLIASERALFLFNLETQAQTQLCPLEAEMPITRSNDGRADPWGGFWIGTMGKKIEANAGAIYRYYKGELRRLYGDISISNSICFDADGTRACFTDTPTGKIMAVRLDKDGWPKDAPWVLIDSSKHKGAPDGSVIDANGRLWNARWGASCVACYDLAGRYLQTAEFPATQVTCPAFAGQSGRLFCTSAMQGIGKEERTHAPEHGMTFECTVDATGQCEHQIIL